MKLSAIARFATCALLCLCPALLGHCGGATGSEPGTETGNPPRVDAQKLRLVIGAAGAELIGEAGAVSSGASVLLENRSTGAAVEVTASTDGSFRVEVAGSPLDTYEVTVTHRGGTVTMPVAATPGALEMMPESGLGNLSCAELEDVLPEQLRLALEPAALGCTRDDDCEVQSWGLGCYQTCNVSYLFVARREAAGAAAAQNIAPYCAEIERRCEPAPAPVCNTGFAVAECNQGTCQALSLAGVSCEDLSSRAETRRADAINNADRSCRVDADCQLVAPGLSCVAGCNYQVSVAASAVEALLANVANVEARYCSTFDSRACPAPIQPPCAPQSVDSFCIGERCQALPVMELP